MLINKVILVVIKKYHLNYLMCFAKHTCFVFYSKSDDTLVEQQCSVCMCERRDNILCSTGWPLTH